MKQIFASDDTQVMSRKEINSMVEGGAPLVSITRVSPDAKFLILASSIFVSVVALAVAITYFNVDLIDYARFAVCVIIINVLLFLCVPQRRSDLFQEGQRYTPADRQTRILYGLHPKSKFPEGEQVLFLDAINGKGFTERK